MNQLCCGSHQDEQIDGFDAVGSIETNVVDNFTMVSVGDLIVTRALTTGNHPGFGEVVQLLRAADVTFGNLETNIFDIRSFNGSPQAEYGGAYHVSLPELGPDLKAMGFNMVSYANNHTFDWGLEGMRETTRVLDQMGIVHAGAGENQAQAGAARFLETPRGRVAVVSSATTFTPMSRAADPAGEAPGRPGINSLRVRRTVVVNRDMFEDLKAVRKGLPGFRIDPDDHNEVSLAGVQFRAGDTPGYSFEPNSRDVDNIRRNVRRGKQLADFCIATNHGHEPGNWSQEPADYEQAFARRLIDAGADAYIGHGPHQLRGIEIYRGRPIFYSLGNFIMDDLRSPAGADMFELHGKDPRVHTDAEVTAAEMSGGYGTDPGFSDPIFYESIVALSRYKNNRLSEVRLFPIELGHSRRLANRGIPGLASPAKAKTVLERLQRLSKPFETLIDIEDNIGIIRVAP